MTGAASLGAHVTSRGLNYTATGTDLVPINAPLVVHDLDQERRAVGNYFVAKLGRARAADVLALCRSWQPDVVVRDEVDFGSAVAAQAAAVPHVPVVVIGAGGFVLPEVVREPLDALAASFGLPRQDNVAMLHRHLTLTPFPASFRDPADPLPGKVVGYRQLTPSEGASSARPLRVYVTWGRFSTLNQAICLRQQPSGPPAAPRSPTSSWRPANTWTRQASAACPTMSRFSSSCSRMRR